jgi:probable F420-dependent oxidoreductase
MDIGIVVLPTDTSARLDDLAVAAEERGLTHLYAGGDHTHVPAARTTPFPGGDELPEEYKHTYDPLIALAAAAARTSSIRLGTCIHLVAQRDPISTAKQVASLDALAPGRIDYGVGYGWNVEEAADHGVEWRTRRARVHEYLAAMHLLWTEDEPSFDGEFVSFERAWLWPKPATPPRVILGASPGPRTFEAIADWGDGWFPVPFWGHTPDHVAELRKVAVDRGRDPEELAVVVDGVLADPAMIDPWAEAAVEAVVIPIMSVSLEESLPQLDAAAAMIERYRQA